MITFKDFLMICEGKKKENKKKKDKKLSKKEKKNLTKGIVKPPGNFNINNTERPVDTKPGSPEREIQVKEIMRQSGAKAIQKELERRRKNGG